MSTQFETDFHNGDIIESEHLKQFAQPINNLESGAAVYREATNASGVYQVDFQSSANPNGHAIDSLAAGQLIVFKASHNSPASAELKVLTEGGTGSETHPLFLGDTQAGADDILADQMVVVLFNDTITPRFDIVGLAGVSGGGGSGAGSLDDLTDVVVTSPITGEVLRYDGSDFVNQALEIADVSGLQTAIDAKQEELTGTADVPGLDDALDGKENKSEKGQAGGYAGLDGSGFVPLDQGGTGADLSTTGGAGQVLKQSSSGGVISVGTLSAGDVGAIPTSEKGASNGVATLDSNGLIPQGQIPAIALERLTVVADQTARFALTTSDVQNGDVVKQTDTMSTFVVSDDTNLHSAAGYTLITSAGAAPVDSVFGRVGAVTQVAGDYSASQIDNDSGVSGANVDDALDQLDSDLAGKADLSHTHDADDITSGTLPIARGGTGATSASSARASLGLAIGSDVQAYNAFLSSLSGLSVVVGDLIYGSGTNAVSRLAKGSAGQVLTMNSGATAPEWADAPSGLAHGARLWSTAGGSVANTTPTKFNANQSEQWGSECVPNTGTDSITVQSDGLYLILWEGQWNTASSTSHWGFLQVRVNGSGVANGLAPQARSTSGGLFSDMSFGHIVMELSANDCVEVYQSVSSTVSYWWVNSIELKVVRLGNVS